MKKPNIIFIHTDSMDGRKMGSMGDAVLKGLTKNLDALAQEGTLYKNAYCNSPICCPSRASMMSGLWTHHCEGWNNYKGLDEGYPTYHDKLEEAGYNLKILGKTDFLSGRHTVRARVSPWTRSANLDKPNYIPPAPQILDRGRRVHQKDWENIVDPSIDWIRTESQKSNPFFLYVGLNVPHPPFASSDYYMSKIDAGLIDIPPYDPTEHPSVVYQIKNKNWQHGFDEKTKRYVRQMYYAMILETDEMVGDILQAAKDMGVYEETYVIFSSDHGEFALEHQQFYKMSPYEPSVRIPLIIKGPDVKRNNVSQHLVSLIDLYPTFMDMSEREKPDGLDGKSLLPDLTGKGSYEGRDWVLTEYHDTTCNTGCFMLRKGQWKYNVYVGYPSQLFDMENDPYELNDLTNARPEVVKELDGFLRTIVDYEEVDKKVKAYDKSSFRAWREERLQVGDYKELMSRVFSGWDRLGVGEGDAWKEEDEEKIINWMNS